MIYSSTKLRNGGDINRFSLVHFFYQQYLYKDKFLFKISMPHNINKLVFILFVYYIDVYRFYTNKIPFFECLYWTTFNIFIFFLPIFITLCVHQFIYSQLTRQIKQINKKKNIFQFYAVYSFGYVTYDTVEGYLLCGIY